MKKLITISVAGGWVLRHREDEILPIDFLKNTVSMSFTKGVAIQNSSLTELEILVTDGEVNTDDIVKKIKEEFAKKYEINDVGDVMSIDVEDEEPVTNSAQALDKLFEELDEALETVKEKVKENEEKKEEKKEKPSDNVDKCLEEINALIGGDEFKKLSLELKNISSQIIQNKTYDIVSYQSFLFSINDGYGLTTYLSSLSKLMYALNIKNMTDPLPASGARAPIEEKLPPPKGNSTDPFNDVRSILHRSGPRMDITQILCIDISEWLNSLDTNIFKDFLMDVERNMYKFIVVFRIPFVDKEVLEKIRYSLNDLMFVRTVSFPPFTKAELQKFAKGEIEKYGFHMSANAWEGFHERIAEERSDGKFYGINTLKKVIRELLYKKQLDNAKRGKNDLCISKKDTYAICANRQSGALSGYEMLSRLVGGEKLKQRIGEIISQIEFAKKNPELKSPCIHMRFVGNPGTGKTTVARIIGKILKEKGVLRVGNFYEYAGRDFCGRYIGETAPKTASMCRDAYGSVLFIDEAYSLYRGAGNDKDYGREALDTLIAEMENHRSDFVVIMAGYTDDMEKLMEGNAGLASRMPYVIDFPNFTREELYDIFVSMLTKQFKYEPELLPTAKEYFLSIPDEIISAKEFSNARFVRNLFERTWAKAAMRCQLGEIETIVLTKDDFERSVCDKEFTFIMKKKHKLGF